MRRAVLRSTGTHEMIRAMDRLLQRMEQNHMEPTKQTLHYLRMEINSCVKINRL